MAETLCILTQSNKPNKENNMFDSYNECIGQEVARPEVIREIEAHGASVAEFDDEVGDFDTYLATTVLDWLGY